MNRSATDRLLDGWALTGTPPDPCGTPPGRIEALERRYEITLTPTFRHYLQSVSPADHFPWDARLTTW